MLDEKLVVSNILNICIFSPKSRIIEISEKYGCADTGAKSQVVRMHTKTMILLPIGYTAKANICETLLS